MLQGKLLIKEQLKHNSHQPHKFVCEVNQLSTDMLANRIIKSALVFLEQLAGASQAYQSQSMSLSAALMSKLVCWRQITELNHYERQRLSPLYQRAKQQLTLQPLSRSQRQSADKLLDLAYWLLQMQYSALPTGNGVSHKDGQMRLCLLINMNQAFEQWASLRLTQLFEQSSSIDQPIYQTFTQQKDIWLRDATGQTCLSIQPDLLIYDTATKINSQKQRTGKAGADASHCSHVIDIKWKTLTHARDISATDAYQLTSYAQAYQAKQVWLVYPVIDDSPQPVALQQFIDSIESNHAILWLMPFNVTTGTLNKTTLST
jgi:5-methylcytosine-specific restriction enzyme subunit McrC